MYLHQRFNTKRIYTNQDQWIEQIKAKEIAKLAKLEHESMIVIQIDQTCPPFNVDKIELNSPKAQERPRQKKGFLCSN